MRADQFNQLDYYDQMEAVLGGTYLADRLTERHYIRLYNLDCMYIEVFFDERTHLITWFHAFEYTFFVLPYLENLNLAV
jgi:hypothetical protein